MGACDFYASARGADVKTAFKAAVDDAQYEYGHGGYTGSIAEKDDVIVVSAPLPKAEGQALAEKLTMDENSEVSDKWGPAGAVNVAGTDEWLFFGWASS